MCVFCKGIAAAASLVLLGSCGGSTENTRIYLRTDAETSGSPLFQRLRLEIYRGAAPCEGCFREVAVDARTFPSGIASFDVGGSGEVRVRARLFRVRGNTDPRSESTIDVTARVVLDGTNQVVDLPMAAVGKAPPEATALRLGGEPSALAPSVPAPRSTCPRPASPDEVCVPAGYFWMGDPTFDPGNEPQVDGRHERLVALDAFLLDRTEVTVSAYRASGLATDSLPRRHFVVPRCTYADADDPARENFDPRPVNCVPHRSAGAFCAALGKDLPTEAELEYAQGAMRSFRYVWGEELPRCGDAIVAGDGCKAELPQPVGSAPRDALRVGAAAPIVDLVGNVHEFTKDLWNPETGPCWGSGFFFNPVCTTPTKNLPTARVIRGGGYSDPTAFSQSAVREYVDQPDTNLGTPVGFRCVRRLSQ
jgi:formylglycine-generating enzyme